MGWAWRVCCGRVWLSRALLRASLTFLAGFCHFAQRVACLLPCSFLIGEGNGTPLQYSCLENLVDGGAWWAAVHGVTRSWTRLHFHFRFSLSCIGEGNGNPLQCSCLESPRNGGAWWAAVYGVAQSRTQLKRLSSRSKVSEVAQVKLEPGVSMCKHLPSSRHTSKVRCLEHCCHLHR